jgi:flagellin-like hook-associated protein FlgL
MADITLSSAVRSNLLSLQNTAELLGRTQERLATGLKVNSALDDPTAFFTASSLNSRASDLGRLLDSIGLAVQTLDAADKAISAITDLVETAQATARQALQSSSTTASATGTVTLTAGATLDTLGFADSDTVEITAGGNTTTFTVGTATVDTVQDLIDGLAANADATVALVGGNLQIEATDGGDLVLGEGAQGTNLDDLGLTAGTITGAANATRTTLAATFDDLRTQITQLAQDAGFNGNNLLQGDNLQVIFNEDSTSSITISGVDFDAAGLGITASTLSFQTNASINASLAELDTAVDTLQSQASTFGSNLTVVSIRQDFTKGIINTLQTGAANLTLADSNEEGANMLALQTRQALSSTALSLAAQADQNVLRLFG